MDAPTDGRYIAFFIDITYQKEHHIRSNNDATTTATAGDAASNDDDEYYFAYDSSVKDIFAQAKTRIDAKLDQIKERIHEFRDSRARLFPMPRDKPGRLEFTTQVSVLPNAFPYDDCHLDTCKGVLL